MTKQSVDKLDVASRLLNTAISLWFSDEDAISIHVLACSAHQIVHDINKKRGGRDLIYDSLNIKDEFRKATNKKFKKCYNFFKHAEKDPSGVIEFDPVSNELFILFTSGGLELLGRKPDKIRGAFTTYYCFSNPEGLTPTGYKNYIEAIPEDIRKNLLKSPKKTFFDAYMYMQRDSG